MRILFLCILLLVCPLALGQDVLPKGKQMVDEFDIFMDFTHQHDAVSVQNLGSNDWQAIHHGNINLGYTQATVWIKLRLSNPHSKPIQRLLDVTYPLLDFVSLYEAFDQQLPKIIMRSGDRLPFTQRTFKHPGFISTLNLQANQQHNYLVKIKSGAPIQTELILWTANAFQSHYRQQSSILFFYLGLILSSAAFNFLVFLYLKEKVYLAYSLYAASFALFMTSQHAILFEYVFPSAPELHHWSQLLLSNMAISFTALFNLLFLKIKTFSKSGWGLLTFITLPVLLLLGSSAMSFTMAIQVTVFGALIIIPAIFVIGLFNVKKNTDGWLFIAAWVCLFIGIITFLTSKIGLIGFSPLINHSILIGSALELLIFAAALARRIHSEKVKRIQAQQIIIEGSKQTAKLHEDIIYSTTHHNITGLPNRNYFERWLNLHLRKGKPCTLVLFHLSRLHEIDKTLGREISNEALEAFGLKLNSEIQLLDNIEVLDSKESFYVATLSASTHGLIINKAISDSLLSHLKYFQGSLNTALMIDNLEIDPYVHCAYALYPEHGRDAQILMRHAGIALDAAPNFEQHIVQYTKEINPYNERRLKLMAELKRAIGSNTLDLYYQPLVDTYNGQFIGAEALIRWPHVEYGLIMPDEFIHIAEKTGVIQALSLWVIRTAVQPLKAWVNINPDFLLSVNVSALNLQDNKFISALHILFEDDLKLAKNMILEVTESQMMTDTQHAMKNLWDLSELGFHIAIDDFGTGYSNLAYLTKLPASELKIDKAFILNLENEPQNQVLVATAIQLAHNLGLKVVAEGVESEDTRILLGKLNCDFCQGFHFSRALPLQAFNGLYADNRA